MNNNKNNMYTCNWENTCFPLEDKGWSNIRGYGEMVNNSFIQNRDIVRTVSPWNRIQPLYLPTDTEVNTKYAWSPPISQNLLNNIRSDCNICPKHSQTTYNGCIHNLESPTLSENCCPRSTWRNNRVKCMNK